MRSLGPLSRIFLLLVVLVLAGTALVVFTAPETPKILSVLDETNGPVLIKNVRVFDGENPALITHAGVLIEDGTIVDLFQSPASLSKAFPDQTTLTVIEGNDGVLMPALIDFHTHFGMSSGRPPWDSSIFNLYPVQYEYDAYLYAGITSVVVGSPIVEPFFGSIEGGPRIYTASKIITAKDSHPVPMLKSLVPWPLRNMAIKNTVLEIGDEQSDPGRVQALLENDTHHTKIIIDGVIPPGIPKLLADDVAQIITASHARNKPVYVHAADPIDAYQAAKAGADVLMHAPYQGKFDEEMLDFLSASRTPVVTTTQIWEWIDRGISKQPPFTPLERTLMAPGTYASLSADWTKGLDSLGKGVFSPTFARTIAPQFHDNLRSNIQAMIAHDVVMIAGTDYGVPGLTPGASLVRELQNLSALGIPNLKVLQMATSIPGKLLEPDGPALGVVRQSALAELILLGENPVENLGALDRVSVIFSQGRIIKRAVALRRDTDE